MKILNSKIHGIVDYLFVLFLFASPSIFGLQEQASLFTYILGAIHLVITVSTNFEYGIIRIILFKHHGWIELIVSFALVGVAFYLGEVENELSRNFYFAIAILVFLTWLLSDYKSETENDFIRY
jgi:hypothetical protein